MPGGDTSTDGASGPRSIFVSYRRDDVPDAARLLAERLRTRFPSADVYLDVDQEAGVDWEQRLRDRGAAAAVFLAVLGLHWLEQLRLKSAAMRASGAVDYGRREIEWALRDWPGEIIPVLVNCRAPAVTELPRSIRGLLRRQATEIRHETFERDVEALLQRLQQPASRRREDTDPDAGGPEVVPRPPAAVPAPDLEHYREVLEAMAAGIVVPWLGSCVRGTLPDSRSLAAGLVESFPDLRLSGLDLAEIAQHISMRKGQTQLRSRMRELIERHSEPIDVHRFLAAFPGQMRRQGRPPAHQLIISTNYDRALERAFEQLDEPFDYVVYKPSNGTFVHFPWGERDAEPVAETISDPSGYDGFPIDDDYELQRTIIVKLHGAPTFSEGKIRWTEDYVVTEDHYIDYLPTQTIADYLPVQVLDKLTGSRALFLGYRLGDWSARVLLRRIWQGRPMSESSWAVQNAPDGLEKASWSAVGHVELLDAEPSAYVSRLRVAADEWAQIASASPGG